MAKYLAVVLIAAVLLVSGCIIGRPPLVPTPDGETTRLLEELLDNPGVLKHTPEVIFRPGDVLAASAIAVRQPISKNQICMSTGDFRGQGDFELLKEEKQQRITYTGENDKTVKIAVVCNVNKLALEKDLSDYLGISGLDCSPCGNGKCCAFVIRRA